VPASCANRAAATVWSECVAVTTPVSDQRHVRLIHALRWNEVEPGVVCKLQARLFWDQADAFTDALHMRINWHQRHAELVAPMVRGG